MGQSERLIDIIRLRERLTAARDWLWETGPDLRYLWISDSLFAATGFLPGDLIGRSGVRQLAGQIADPAQRQPFLAALDTFDRFHDLVCRIETPGLAIRWISVSGEPRFDKTGAFLGYSGQGRDVSSLLKGEGPATVQPPSNDLQLALDAMPMGVVLLDEDLVTQFVNRAYYDMWKVDADDAPVGAHYRTFIDVTRRMGLQELQQGEWDAQVERILDEIRSNQSAPRELQLSDGRSVIFTVKSLANGKRLAAYFDVTELAERERDLKEAEHRAVLADRAKSDFLANMSHEIRTPMNGVLGMAELLSRTELDCKQRTFADIIVKSGNALLTIINDILDFSKIDAGQVLLDPAPFNLAETVEDVGALLSTKAKEKDLELIVRVDPSLPRRFVGDAGRIRQIVTNLVGNAVKFTDTGHVMIDVGGERAENGWSLEIAVSDTGIGIPADKLGLLFEKFSQVDTSSTRRHEGTGLGLAITSRLVELMDGVIGVTSEPGSGSRFSVRLPLPAASGEAEAIQAPLNAAGARVLVVDDNAINRTILMEQMQSWTFNACAATDAEEALKVLAAIEAIGSRVDCAVIDFQMPGMSGDELARQIRANPYFDKTPIILLSSVDEPLSAYRDIDIDAHLVKPARSSALFDTVVSCIGKRAARSEETANLKPRLTLVQGGASAEPLPDGEVDVLVAEDNEVNQLVFRQILGETDLTFEIAGDGEKAVEAFRRLHPRMILMDVSMPGMNGMEATQAIRSIEQEAGGHVPIVGVTAHALKDDRERCISAGMDDYLPKPISPNALLAKIELWIGVDLSAQMAE